MSNVNMKKAVIDQIILWIMLFVVFVTFFFFIIDYSNTISAKDNTDAVADYTARMVALNKAEVDIVDGANKIKDATFTAIQSGDIVCNTDATISNHQVIVNVYATLTNGFLALGNNNIHSKTVVFNESSEFQRECSLTLSFN